MVPILTDAPTFRAIIVSASCTSLQNADRSVHRTANAAFTVVRLWKPHNAG
jgi:hypothetical protein